MSEHLQLHRTAKGEDGKDMMELHGDKVGRQYDGSVYPPLPEQLPAPPHAEQKPSEKEPE